MSNSLIDDSSRLELSKIAPGVSIENQAVPVGDGMAQAFFVTYDNAGQVPNTWRKIANFIAIQYQTQIENEFGRWNSYLFFCVTEPIGLDLKYLIENDTFSTRKIIIDDKASFEKIINRHILNCDLPVNNSTAAVAQPFSRDELLWRMLEGKILKVKKRTWAAETTFDELCSALKPNNEIQKD